VPLIPGLDVVRGGILSSATFYKFNSRNAHLIRHCKNLALKPLAAGRLKPTRSLFTFIYTYADSVSVGITSEAEMEETYSVAKKAYI